LSTFSIRVTSLLALLLLISVSSLRAQGFSPYIGLGSLRDSAGTTNNSTDSCTSGFLFDNLTSACEIAPTMGGLFGVVGADFMFKRHLGINGEYTLHITPEPYLPSAGLKMRPSFYDLNAIWQVHSGKRLVPFAEGGVGAARVALYFNPANAVTGIPIPTTPFFSNADYFQFHFAAGAKIYIKSKFFVKPQFDLHYAVHLTDQFGRNAVFGYTVSAGYTFGRR